jgi:hypothetical protein
MCHHLCIHSRLSEDDGLSTCLPPKTSAFTRSQCTVLNMHQGTSVQIHQNPPPKRCCRGLKDDHIKALRKIEHKCCSAVFYNTDYDPIITHAPQLNTCACCTAPAPVKSPLQGSPGLAVPHSPPLLPAEGDEGGLENFNGSPVVPHVLLSSGLHTVSSVQDNCALFHSTHHLDDHTSAWNQCCNKQATQWMSVAIPQLMLIYLANHVVTESGRLPPPPKPDSYAGATRYQ